MRAIFRPARRVTEATPEQVVLSGGGLGSYAEDPIDGDRGYKRSGGDFRRDVPPWTRERARDYAVTAYRMNPMATAVIDTHVAFAVGDSGVTPMCTDDKVRQVVDEFWNDPANRLGETQEINLRSQLLLGEQLYELMEGKASGVLRYMPLEPAMIKVVNLEKGNPLWPDTVILPPNANTNGEDEKLVIARVRDDSGLRKGNAVFWAPWRTLNTDIRGIPFLHPILDWLDSYDQVLSNLIDRTALARYMVVDVEVQGGQKEVDAFIAARGGTHIPPSGSMEIHNSSVKYTPFTVDSGAESDTKTNGAVLTQIASGAGLARTWLADPEDANRATSMTMAEPVRRRVGGVQRIWLAQQTELCRIAVDRAVAARRLSATVTVTDAKTGEKSEIPASQAVVVRGPEIAAADASIAAQVMLNLATGLEKLVQIGGLSPEAAQFASRKAWEDFMGVPWRAELAGTGANPDDVAQAVDDAGGGQISDVLAAANAVESRLDSRRLRTA